MSDLPVTCLNAVADLLADVCDLVEGLIGKLRFPRIVRFSSSHGTGKSFDLFNSEIEVDTLLLHEILGHRWSLKLHFWLSSPPIQR